MAHYAWTIRYPGRQDIQKVTTLFVLEEIVRALRLPGLSPAEFYSLNIASTESGSFWHDADGDEKWSLTWTKVDEPIIEPVLSFSRI